MSNVTQILDAIQRGDRQAADQLFPLVYDELRRLAAQKLADEKSGHTLQATALVHESYIRLVGSDKSRKWDTRGHFFAAAAEAMRRIIIDSARRKRSLKGGGSLNRVSVEAADLFAPEPPEDLLAIDEALDRLAAEDPEAAQLVKLRYFAGLSIAETATVLQLSPRTVDRLWAYARAFLRDAIGGPSK